jgi:UDP-N-acetylglucosamine--N-acetylmuramyl-(pentapeptide) pyrophosphoryl-undecaprenol N-acetylglucosamine transferase
MSRREPRILFAGGGTGGHLYPALALGEAVLRRSPGARVFFVGARRGVEARVLPDRGVEHALLPMEPLRRSRAWENWRLLPAGWRSLRLLRQIFRDFRPDVVVGTGGYASGPALAFAAMRGIPIAVQEQNSYPGLVTRLLARRVRQLHLAFPEARQHLRPGRGTQVMEHGNPIQPPARATRDEGRARFGLGGGFVVLVMGGSQGARRINESLLADLAAVSRGEKERPAGMEILWATGPASYEEVAQRVATAGAESWVHVHSYIQEMPLALASADLAVSRAGAMSLAELCAWGIPSLLIPFPFAAADHQTHNARALADAGAAVMVAEESLAPGRIWEEVTRLAADDSARGEMAKRASERGRPEAADRIVEDLFGLLPEGVE